MPPRLAISRNSYSVETSTPSQPFEPNFGFVRAARIHGQPFHAVVALLLGGTSGGRYAGIDRVCRGSPKSFFTRHLRSLKRARVLLIGATPSACPAVRRNGDTALMRAAISDHPAIFQKLLDARADVNTKDRGGCALPWPVRRVVGGGRLVRQLRRAAPSGRDTALHWAAAHGLISAGAELLVGGADRRITDSQG